jgi:outer membrane receptor for ferrienterochelin and colicin
MSERRAFWYRKATVKTQFSPRLGVAFPITDQGVVHFSYGHFFQIPNFSYLYENPEFKFGTGAGNLGIAGNPDLKPEQTIVGEVGVQQGLTEDLSIDVTGYFRNIRNLTGTRADEILLYGGSGRYSQYVNSDFGFVRGIVLTVTRRMAGGWGATVDYTFQSVKGNASDPAATRNQLVGGAQPEVQLVPLNWDQRHTLNATVSYARAGDWGVSVIAQYGSGFPYTPTQSINVSDLLTNSELRPPGFTVDLRANKDFRVWGTTLTLFARVFNLLDAKNQLQVYANSGTADFTLDEYLARRQGLPPVVNTIDEYYRNPLFYSEPRRVEMGFTVSWE